MMSIDKHTSKIIIFRPKRLDILILIFTKAGSVMPIGPIAPRYSWLYTQHTAGFTQQRLQFLWGPAPHKTVPAQS